MCGLKTKQVIVVRADLNMTKGKIAAQVAHASVGALLNGSKIDKGVLSVKLSAEAIQWFHAHHTKVVCRCGSEEELVELYEKAKAAGVPCQLIVDAGFTAFNGVPTKTVCGIGPASSDIIDKITGNLRLL